MPELKPLTVWEREPAALINCLRLTLLASMAFGLNLTTAQLVAFMAAIEGWLTLVTRTQVTPTARVEQQRGS